MGFYVGRALQLIAMIQLLFALYTGFIVGDWKAEMWMLGAGAGIFLFGRFVERRFAQAG
jgi:hypothetical protein